jgi:hypothetical protein
LIIFLHEFETYSLCVGFADPLRSMLRSISTRPNMILFGIINFTYTWYDPKGAIGPQEFADMAVELFLHGFAPGVAEKAITTPPARAGLA